MADVDQSRKIVIVVGAGGTLCDAATKPEKDRPPLDRGFFASCAKHSPGNHLNEVVSYLTATYRLNPSEPEYDSLEQVMCMIFADLHANGRGAASLQAFRHLIRLFNERIASTTNKMPAHKRTSFLRMIASKLEAGYRPKDITVVTFNQDIQIEKSLECLEDFAKYKKYGSIFSFPHCYRIPKAYERLSRSPSGVKTFEVEENDASGISILKLHGSLNWYSIHKSQDVPRASILDRNKKFRITARREILPSMTFNSGKKRQHTFPLVVPPVTSKSSMIHQDLDAIWTEAEDDIASADEVIVFGYSCPATDYESANLLRRSISRNKRKAALTLIDPNPAVVVRYATVTGIQRMQYFRSCDSYLDA